MFRIKYNSRTLKNFFLTEKTMEYIRKYSINQFSLQYYSKKPVKICEQIFSHSEKLLSDRNGLCIFQQTSSA